MSPIHEHLYRLRDLEPGNINYMHEYLCSTEREDLIRVSKLIADLYEIVESEREPAERERHRINDDTYPERSDFKRSFFRQPAAKPGCELVEHEYFLSLLYSISFSVYVATRNFYAFNRGSYEVPQKHLPLFEAFLEAIENLYVSLDTVAVLVVLVCGVGSEKAFGDPAILSKIGFTNLKEWLADSPFKANFRIRYKGRLFEMLKALRNNRAHRPFVDWTVAGEMVDTPQNLIKVRSICEDNDLYEWRTDEFLERVFGMTCNILRAELQGVLTTYKERFDRETDFDTELKGRIQMAHHEWARILS